MDDNRNKKKETVYEAVINLVRTGKSYHNMKVSDIAVEAGIGKGTIYEYFDSRDTLIAETVMYFLDRYLKQAVDLINSEKSFEKRMCALFEFIHNESAENLNIMDVLFIKGGISDIYSALKGADTFEDFVRVIDGYCRFILMDAEEEGVIKQVEDMDYATYVLKSSVVSFIFSTNAVKRSFETVCGNTMQALLKALN